MTNLLFIDDDAIIRRAIQKNIDWHSHGFHLEYVARDAIEALDYLASHQPDIILTDIRMPVMDGIEMAKKIREVYPDILFIFLSGHEDFQYAKEALKLNAFDYLTKPISNNALLEVIEKASQELKSRTRQKMILTNGLPIVKRHYISRLMQKEFRDLNLEELANMDMPLTDGLGTTAFVDLKGSPSCASYAQVQEINAPNKISFVQGGEDMDQLCGELETLFPGGVFVPSQSRQLFMILFRNDISTEADFSVLIRELEQPIKDEIQNRTGLKAELYFGSLFRSPKELSASFSEARKRIMSRDDNLTEQIKSYIYHHYPEEDLSLKSIANAFHINHCYMTVMFKKEAGIGVYDFLIKTRMEKAKELLIHTDKKIYEISSMVGYSNSQYFSNSFKKHFNCTVSEFRKENQT